MSERPRVSVIVTAYNLAPYLPLALDSALAQELPGGAVQIIVVDDGSTDDTPQVLERYANRVQVIHQPNGGLVAAVDRGLAAVRGEFVALLDADDEWPRDRLRRHVEILQGRPEVGLVHGDMEVIDAGGATIHPSFFTWKQDTPSDGRVLPRLIGDNFVSGGASTFRASLLPAIWPICPEAIYPDWWIATNIAAVAEIVYEPGNANRYRYHGANMGLGADRAAVLAIERRELPFRRWMMQNLIDDHTVTIGDVGRITLRWRGAVVHSGLSHPGGVREILPVDPAMAAEALASASARADGVQRCKGLLQALSRDPLDAAILFDLETALLRVTSEPGAAAPLSPAVVPPPLITLRARPRLTLAWLDELVCRPELLSAYAQRSATDENATLMILASVDADLAPLISLVEADGRLADERCDIQAIAEPSTTPARNLLAAWAGARLSAREPAAPFARLPRHDAVDGAGAGDRRVGRRRRESRLNEPPSLPITRVMPVQRNRRCP